MSQTIFGSLPGAEVDGTKDDLEEEEIRPLIYTGDSELRKAIVEGLSKGFTYLEDRLTGNCAPNFDCRETYELLDGQLVRHRVVVDEGQWQPSARLRSSRDCALGKAPWRPASARSAGLAGEGGAGPVRAVCR